MACNHKNVYRIGKYESGNYDNPLFWCGDCGAIRYNYNGRWELPKSQKAGPAKAGEKGGA